MVPLVSLAGQEHQAERELQDHLERMVQKESMGQLVLPDKLDHQDNLVGREEGYVLCV